MHWLLQRALISFVFVFAQQCICACIIPRSRKWKMRCAEIATNNLPALSSTHSNCPSPIWQLPIWCIAVIMITCNCNHNSVLWDSTNRCIAIVIITAQLTVPAWLYSAHPPFLTQPFTSNYLPPLISTLCIFNNFFSANHPLFAFLYIYHYQTTPSYSYSEEPCWQYAWDQQ